MSKTSFENYGILAKKNITHTEIAGRYSFQKQEEKNILFDIMQKMEITSDDDLLEIGCGTGSLLIPLSFFVNSATGVDHLNVISTFKTRINNNSIKLISGNFLDVNLKEKYSKILIYSVLHCLSDEREVIAFIEKALSYLKPGGSLIIGDIPNIDKKNRFFMTDFAKKIQKKHDQKILHMIKKREENIHLVHDKNLVTFDDILIMRIMKYFREKNFETYLVPQLSNLPFCYTREDIIIKRLK